MIVSGREFLIWRSGLEADRRRWEVAPGPSKDDALLVGLTLLQAQEWHSKRGEDLPGADREFLERSIKA
jgi:hypothetical protein